MKKFLDTEKRLNDTDISDFEQSYNVKLPETYKNHIKLYNGGYPEDDLYFLGYPIDNFLPIKFGESTIEDNLELIGEFLPNNSIPFAESNGGIIYFELNNQKNSKIFCFYSDGQTDFLANSFDEFVNGLTEGENV